MITQTETKEYKVSNDWAIFLYVIFAAVIGLFSWFLFKALTESNLHWIFIPVILAVLAATIVGIIEIRKARLIIYPDSIKSVSVLTTRELQFDEIKGFRIEDKFTFVESKYPDKKRIRVSQYFEGYSEIQSWLASNFDDLYKQAEKAEKEEILSNENFGLTHESREQKLNNAKKISKVVNGLAIGLFSWIFLYPRPYEYAMLACIILPLAAIIIMKAYRGLILPVEKKGSAYPSMLYALMSPGFGLLIRALQDFDIYDYSKVWIRMIILTAILLVAVFIKQGFAVKEKIDYMMIFVVTIALAGYSFGAIVEINCFYDNSAPQQFDVKVLGKRVSSGKSRSYHLKLSEWRLQKKDELKVDEEFYEKVSVGDDVEVNLKQGRLDIPWVFVVDKE